MIPLSEATEFVIGSVNLLKPVRVALAQARGSVLVDDVQASEAVPPFANTAMDGFAVRAQDMIGAPRTLEVVGTVAAGDVGDIEVAKGQAARIMTGAPMPPGADAVIMVELTEPADDGSSVRVIEPVSVGNHVREVGEDIQPGDTVFTAGTRLSAGHLGVLASLGSYEVDVFARPRVGVISTGDELVDGPQRLQRGQIHDSNRHTLLALVEESGFEAIDLGLIADDKDSLSAAIIDASSDCDALISSGGVSMGDFDFVKVVLDEIGEMRWMQVAIKPAKPLAFGFVNEMPVFGLPGNPVSSMVSYELFARPALLKMAGNSELERPIVMAVADEDLRRHPDGKTHFARVIVHYEDDTYRARTAGGQGSHQLTAMAYANALAVLPDGDGASAGETIRVMLLE
ncbi:MAG: gephyrin-like molybdotransferase Glp [Acidimicrobiales bacterium]